MKEAIIHFGDKKFKVEHDMNETYNQVIIYRLEGDTPSPIYAGSTLKEACLKWLALTDDISVVVECMELWAEDNNIHINSLNIMETGKIFDEYVATLTGEELFILLMPNDSYYYVDWSLVDEVM